MANKPIQQTAFFKLGNWSAKRRWWIIASWVIVIVTAASLAPYFQKNVTTTSMFVRDSGAQQAQKIVDSKFSKAYAEQDLIVFQSKDSDISDERYQAYINKVTQAISEVAGVVDVVSPTEMSPQAGSLISADKRIAIAFLSLDGTQEELKEITANINDELSAFQKQTRFEVYVTGTTPMMNDMIEKQGSELAKAEMFGIPVAIVVLLLAFGSLVAASLPLVMGMMGLLTTFGALGLLSFFHAFDTTVQSMTSMIGLGVGIDYVLFLVRRFREELASGRKPSDAVAYMIATTGKAIFFSGITVLISMAGLYWLQAAIFTNIAIGTMLVVAVMMAVSLTLLPAILAVLGERVNRLRIFRKKNSLAHNQVSTGWLRWPNFVLKRPKMWASVGIVVLLLLTTQAFQMKLGMDTGAKTIADTPSGIGMSIVNEQFSSGLLAPVTIVISNKKGTLNESNWQEIQVLTDRISNEDEVYKVDGLTTVVADLKLPFNEDTRNTLTQHPMSANLKKIWNFDQSGDTTTISVTLHSASDSSTATKWVRELRDEIIPAAIDSNDLEVHVGGSSMAIAELTDETWGKTPYVIVTVLALSYVLLLLAFRSWLIPLKAIFLNLLSVGASFGLLVWVFMGGHGSWIGVDQIEFIQVFLPVIAFAVLFGLSMDYEVFLVSRMKEEWGRTRNVDEAISNGIAHTSGPITQAAIIMIAVFLAFLLTKGDMQQIGFALGMAILIDVTIVRSLLVPTLMKLLGSRSWQLPAWLDRIVPHVELAEGEAGKKDL